MIMEAQPTPPTQHQLDAGRLTIIWTDAPGDAAVAMRNEIRARGEKCVIRDSSFYASNCVEPAVRLVIFNCGLRDQIIADYRSPGYIKRFGHVDVQDAAVDAMNAPTSLPPPLAEVVAEQEASAATGKMEDDQLDQQLTAMSDDDLRAYVRSITGKRQRWNASKDTLIKNLRIHLAGGQVEDVSEEDARAPKTPEPAKGDGEGAGSDGIGAQDE